MRAHSPDSSTPSTPVQKPFFATSSRCATLEVITKPSPSEPPDCDRIELTVTSSSLCKSLEGAGFPFQVKAIEDGIDNSVHTFHIYKADHRSGPSSDLDKAALDNIGGAQLLPEMFWETEKR